MSFYEARHGKDYGLQVDGIRPDMGAIIARKDKVVGLLRNGIAQLFRKNGVSLYEGHGKILSPDELEVETKEGVVRLRAKKVVIGTGSRPIVPGPFVGHDRGVFTTDDLFDIAAIPGSLLIVGAGAIGVEMASIMAGLGSMVTLLEMEKTILPREDGEMSAYLTRMLKRHNVRIMTGISVTEVVPGEKMRLTLSDGRVLEADAVLVAAGRAPNVEGTGLEKIGLDVANGSLSVNDRMETAIPGTLCCRGCHWGLASGPCGFFRGHRGSRKRCRYGEPNGLPGGSTIHFQHSRICSSRPLGRTSERALCHKGGELPHKVPRHGSGHGRVGRSGQTHSK